MKNYHFWRNTFIAIGCFAALTSCLKAQRKVGNTEAVRKESKGVQNISTEQFCNLISDFKQHPAEWKFKGERPAIVDFYAVWCGPCRKVSPIMDSLAVEYKGKIDFYKVDVDKQEDIAMHFNIRSIPTILFVPKKGEPYQQVGAIGKAEFKQIIDSILVKR